MASSTRGSRGEVACMSRYIGRPAATAEAFCIPSDSVCDQGQFGVVSFRKNYRVKDSKLTFQATRSRRLCCDSGILTSKRGLWKSSVSCRHQASLCSSQDRSLEYALIGKCPQHVCKSKEERRKSNRISFAHQMDLMLNSGSRTVADKSRHTELPRFHPHILHK